MIIEFSPDIILEEWANGTHKNAFIRHNRPLNYRDTNTIYITMILVENYYDVAFWGQLFFLQNHYQQSRHIKDLEETKDYVDQFLLQMKEMRVFL